MTFSSRQGFTVSPTIDEATGDFTGMSMQPSVLGGGFESDPNDFYEDVEGNAHHAFENYDPDVEQNLANDEQYYAALSESDPRIPDALQWASSNAEDEFIAQFHEAQDNGDYELVNEMLEVLLSEYELHGDYTETLEQPSNEDAIVEEWYDQLDDNLLVETIEEISDSISFDDATTYETYASFYPENTLEHQLFLAGSEIANGEYTVEDAWMALAGVHGPGKVAKAYLDLSAQYANSMPNEY